MLAATIPIHSTGVNWGQAAATWIPIVLALVGAMVASIHAFRKWQDRRADRLEAAMVKVAQGFATAITTEMQGIHQHLSQQDKRFDRLDRAVGTDSS